LIGQIRVHTLLSGYPGCGHTDVTVGRYAKNGIARAGFCASRKSGVVLTIIFKTIFSESFFANSGFFFDFEP
jgi:hypothetical protein